MTTTLSPLSRPQWRLLNHLENDRQHGRDQINAWKMLAVEDGTHDDLKHLQEAEHIEAFLDDVAVVVADVIGRRGSLGIEVRLTAKGRRTVTGTPWMRVLRTLADTRSGSRTVQQIKTNADADDDLLKEMDRRGLISVTFADELPLGELQRLPDGLLLRITDRGREYLPH